MYFRFLLMIPSARLTDFEDFMRPMRGWQISQSTYLTPSMHPELRLLPVPFLQANLGVNFHTLQLCTSLARTRNCKITCIYEESATACSNSYLLYPTTIAIQLF